VDSGRGRKLYATFLVLAVATLAVSALAFISSNSSAYTAHDPIIIASNADFNGANGVTSGTGTISDPYIIDDWSISAGTANGISISDTSAYYVIANVSISHDTYNYNNYNGINLDNAPNGRVENSTISGWVKIGVYVKSSSNVELYNNTISNTGFASNDRYCIRMDSCLQDVSITQNNLSDANYGVLAYASTDIQIDHNNITGTERGGVSLSSTKYSVISQNTMDIGGVAIYGYVISDFNTHTISTDNVVNNKPVRYERNATALDIDGEDLAQVILANCSSTILSNMVLGDAAIAVDLGYCNDTTIADCTLMNNVWYGICTQYSTNLTVTDTTIHNSTFGVYAYVGSVINVNRSRVNSSSNTGFYMYSVSKVNISYSTISNCTPFYGAIRYQGTSSAVDLDSYITYNVIRDNSIGVTLINAGGVHVNHNDFINNDLHANDTSAGDNFWDDGIEGNYWDNYTGDDLVAPFGIGDEPLLIDFGTYDNYPLMEYQAIPEFQDVVVPVMFVLVIFGLFRARMTRQ